jgi:DNA-binding GntR family transcriptional regulator
MRGPTKSRVITRTDRLSPSATRGSGTIVAFDLDTRSMKVAITDIIREAIVTGRYPLGSKISEKILALELKVSRTPVREALQVLRAEGLIVVQPQSGTFVFSTSAGEIAAVCEMRLVLETAALRLGLRRGRLTLAERLERVVAEAVIHLGDDLERVHKLDTQFHRTLIEGSENSFLVDAYRTISDRLHALRQLMPLTKPRLSNAVVEHRRIIESIRTSDLRMGQRLLTSHIEHVEQVLLERIPFSASRTKQPTTKHNELANVRGRPRAS